MNSRAVWQDGGLRIQFWPDTDEEREAVKKLYSSLGDPSYFMLLHAVFESPAMKGAQVSITMEVPRPTEEN